MTMRTMKTRRMMVMGKMKMKMKMKDEKSMAPLKKLPHITMGGLVRYCGDDTYHMHLSP